VGGDYGRASAGVSTVRPGMTNRAHDTSEQEYSSVLSTILDASTEYSIVAVHLDGTFLLWNEGAHRIYGYEASEAMGLNLRMLYPPEAVAAGQVDEILSKALHHGHWEGVSTRVRKNGEVFPARIVISVRRDAQGRPIGYLSISKDISEEDRLQQRLRASEAYNREIIESASDGLLITDLEGRITDVNKEMESLSGTSRKDLLGTHWHELIAPPAGAADVIERVLADGRVKDYELKLRQPGGSYLDISCNASVLLEGREHATGILAAVRDIAESKRLRDQLEARNRELEIQNQRVQEANRMKSEFLASVSHELRTPLNSIIGFSDFLLTDDEGALSSQQREYLTDILTSGNHLLSLINDVLDLAKVESGKLDLRPVSFPLPVAIDEVCSSLRPQLLEHELELKVDVPSSIDRVVLDVVRFKQILYNLLSNAVKFTPKGGSVSVTVAPAGETRFMVSIHDTGIGIPAKDLRRIFREFEQLDTGTTRRYSGTGLGLPVTQRLVDLMGGTIAVESAVGVGSTFEVRLPWVRPPASLPSAPGEGVRA
jgi:PAS domain S-box-containing protein